MLSLFRNHKSKAKEGFFQKNGATILEQLIHDFNGNCNPIQLYSAEELKKATNDYHSDGMRYDGWNFRVYKGVHGGREILVKNFGERSNYRSSEFLIATELAVSSNMSNHKNVLKLLGCCLETELATLVFEFPAKGNLPHHIYGDNAQSLPWKTKLKIAIEVADAVSYLHHGSSKVFIHRNIRTENIFLDQDCVAKLSDFQVSLPIPLDQDHVFSECLSFLGHLSPEVLMYNRYTKKSDVFNLGMIMCEILTGKKIYELLRLRSSGDSKELENIMEGNLLQESNMKQVTECSKLAVRCLDSDPNARPTAQEVSQTLRSIKRFQL
ncbi:putative protein kinase RLK-Pelle-WAK family [Rosa chinensis]|uniref:Protein kinase domain-containing protein n=1 Tax=Rosa chinensis TaxID=74649 RepID=A0A2P6RVG2_ROSCH|nr:putative wall-associated receptor kinase-like 16 [Rosa chinensis]PRQ50408.1 putative protein kinase RLK-Pelle-WAK family [Rosa chinensis]